MKTLKALISKAPITPGIYKFLNEKGKVIYIGKAKSLKKRLLSYVQNSKDLGIKKKKMMDSAKGVEWIETNSEVEALILEDNLIKELQPKYNVLLKDDKTFQYIKVSIQNEYPEVFTVRRIEKDGAKYFGPKTNGADVKRLVESVKRIFKLCSVKNITVNTNGKPIEGAKLAVKHGKLSASRPCLDFYIKRCTGPCAGMLTPDEYRKQIDEAIKFLSGDFRPAIKQLNLQMRNYAKDRKFERAGALRNQIIAIERSAQRQLIRDTKLEDRDVIAYIEDLGKNFFTVHLIRQGRLISQENFVTEGGDKPAEIMEAFLREYYALAADIPKEILISIEVNEKEVLEAYIESHTDHKVKLIHPEKGRKDDLIMLAEKNARSFADQSRAKWMVDEKKPEQAIKELENVLKLKSKLKRIECYDISHLSGTETVGSMSVFKKGKPYKSDYRLFRLKTVQGTIDDFKAIAEIIRRRLNYLPAELPKGYKLRTGKKSDEKLLKSIWTTLEDFDVKKFQVLEKKGKAVGFARVHPLSDKVHEISGLYLEKNERGKKLGYHILKKLIEKSKQKRLYMMCRKDLEEYYVNFGFDVLREAPQELKNKLKRESDTADLFLAYQKKKTDLSFTAKPDLIVIDGGKGQLSSAVKVLEEKGMADIPIISLAKREEEVFIPKKSNPINLKSDSEASYLLQRIRDEAHRFAIELNRKSREKTMVKSALDDISGIGYKTKKRLLSHFGSFAAIKDATLEQLVPVCGESIAKKLKKSNVD